MGPVVHTRFGVTPAHGRFMRASEAREMQQPTECYDGADGETVIARLLALGSDGGVAWRGSNNHICLGSVAKRAHEIH